MKIICKERVTGKTNELIEYANTLDGQSVIVCANARDLEILEKRIKQKEYDQIDAVTFHEYKQGRCRGIDANILIDDADLFLQIYAGENPVKAITLTKEGVL